MILDDASDDDELSQQDRRIADVIIKQSRGESQNQKPADVEFEEDLTLPSKRRTRSRKKYVYESDEDENDDDDDIQVSDGIIENLGDENDDDLPLSDDSDDGALSDVSDEFVTPRSSPRKSPVKLDISKAKVSPRKIKGRPPKAESVLGSITSIFEKSDTSPKKMGRPPKAEGVIGYVKSIFLNGSIASESLKKSNTLSQKSEFEEKVYKNTTEYIRIPMVSGIPEQQDEKVEITRKFGPFPLPKVDENGHIVDQEFLDKYFNGKPLNMNQKDKLTDSRAIFMEGAEGYFEQHSIRAKTSSNSVAQLAPMLEYSEFIPYVGLSDKILKPQKTKLAELHRFLYNQWCFELSQGYNLNFYGIGSKMNILLDFVENYLVDWYEEVYQDDLNVLVINGYNPSLKFKNVFVDIVGTFISKEIKKQEKIRFPKQANETVPFLTKFIENRRTKIKFKKLVILIHNIDGESLRDDKTQSLLSQLASLPEIWLIGSVDNINAPLLWDLYRMKNFNFLWHDLTTYDTYVSELSFKDVLTMGRSKKYVGDKGAKFVLSSLTTNARNLYRILLELQVAKLNGAVNTKLSRSSLKGNIKHGVEFKTLYNTCVEEFITSNEINFRTILGEFSEHKMCNVVNDDSGIERVFVPFTIDEMEKLQREEFT
jgi:origin recognition complex subunit 2